MSKAPSMSSLAHAATVDCVLDDASGLNGHLRTGLRDAMSLTKPRILLMCVVTTGMGLLLAPVAVSARLALATLAGTALAVGCSNVLNMIFERDIDRLMKRTCQRPLVTGRLSLGFAWPYACVQGIAAIALLALETNVWAAAVAACAIVLYAFIYTPLKTRTPWALYVGAIPGALPPLVGTVAATGRIETAGVVLFILLFLWQIPHFIAIAVLQGEDYARAGIRVLPLARGVRAARIHAFVTSVLLLFSGFGPLLVPGVEFLTGGIYAAFALFAGMAMLRPQLNAAFWRDGFTETSARRVFRASLFYLPLILFALLLDGAGFGVFRVAQIVVGN